MPPTVVLDLIVVALLVPTIAFAVVLNRRIESLRRSRDDLAKMILAFNEATTRAESGIPKMRKTADEVGKTLREATEKAQTLRDDLAFMAERADSMANRLEAQLREARQVARGASEPPPTRGDLPEPLGMDKPAAEARPAPGVAPGPTLLSALLSEDDLKGDERSEAERELLRALQGSR